MKHHLLRPANALTLGSIACSTAAVLGLLGPHGTDPNALIRAVMWILAAGVLDAADGPVARATGCPSDFGRQLDALADLLAFGLAPAVLAYAAWWSELGHAGAVLAAAWVGATALRLARHVAECDDGAVSVGLPSTMAGGTLATLVWASAEGVIASPDPVGGAFVGLGLAWLMASCVPFRTLKGVRHDRLAQAYLAFGVGSCIVGVVAFGPVGWWLGGATAYGVVALTDVLATLRTPRTSAHSGDGPSLRS